MPDEVRAVHEPVLLKQVIEGLAPEAGMIFVDGTTGSAGHFSAVLGRLVPGGVAIGIDRDEQSLRRAKAKLEMAKTDGVEVHLVHSSFSELERVVSRFGLLEVDRVLLDLGLSSDQLDDPERGFSFFKDGPLDMRQDRRGSLTAGDVVNGYPGDDLLRILREYGEERHSRRIVEAILQRRKTGSIEKTTELAELVAQAVPGGWGRIHPATRTFQALRIEVGRELEELRCVLDQVPGLLSDGGRLAVITFHGLEERVVKQTLRPYSRHGSRTDWQVNLKGKVVKADKAEMRRNPRSRSAKLRIYEKRSLR